MLHLLLLGPLTWGIPGDRRLLSYPDLQSILMDWGGGLLLLYLINLSISR